MLGFKRRGMLVNHLNKRHPNIKPESVHELSLPILKQQRDYYCQHCDKVGSPSDGEREVGMDFCLFFFVFSVGGGGGVWGWSLVQCSVALSPQRPYRLIRDGKPRTATSTFTQLLISDSSMVRSVLL